MERLLPAQHARSSLSGGHSDSERNQFNTRVRKQQRNLCSDTTTFFFVFQNQLTKSATHRWMLNQRCWF